MPEAHESRALALRARRLLGRDRELAEIAESVRCCPVTTLVGPGGVGKTVLATAATIPKSVSAPRLAENFAARTIALTSAERASIAKLDRGRPHDRRRRLVRPRHALDASDTLGRAGPAASRVELLLPTRASLRTRVTLRR